MTRLETLLVLYGSQRGSTEDAAQRFCQKVSEHLGPKGLGVKTKLMTLDDFLLSKTEPWSRLVVIFVSSFGLGGPPLGARKFRKLCDAWIATHKDNPDEPKMLEGLKFVLCGLGDIYYETYMMNPNKIREGLECVGAQMVGEQGKADSSAGKEEQTKAIEEWMEDVWKDLADALSEKPLPDEKLLAMKKAIIEATD